MNQGEQLNELAHQQRTNDGLRELALFAGAGGGILGGHLLGWRTVCAVEWMPYPRGCLIARQDDRILDPFPVWDDVQTFDGRPFAGRIDVVSGGFPCQDISAAGNGEGIDGKRSGMWSHMARTVREIRPSYVFVENSPMLTSRGLGRVLGDLASMGYDANWGVLGGCHVGAPHYRERIWICAHSIGSGRNTCRWTRPHQRRVILEPTRLVSSNHGRKHWDTSPQKKARLLGMADGLAGELDGIKAAGNGQISAVVNLAWETLNTF